MVDTQYLEDVIAKSGKKRKHLAEACGCGSYTLKRKISNLSDFTVNQVDILCKELNIRASERQKIFFKK